MPTAVSFLESSHRSGMVATYHSRHHEEFPSNGKVAADTSSGSTENITANYFDDPKLATNLAKYDPTFEIVEDNDCKRRKKISQKGSTFKQNCKFLIS
jgi:hypothetical protein